MPLIRIANGPQFEAQPGETVLAAALRSGVALDYSCRTGRCSTCRCTIESGESLALADESGLEPADRAAGAVLACVRTATSDLVLGEVRLSDQSLPAAQTLPCRLDSLQRVAEDVLIVRLRLPPSVNFVFRPGQFIELIAPGGQRRSYSLACAYAQDLHLELHVRAVAGGTLSDYWFGRAQVNDLLRLHGPLGSFVLRPDVACKPLVFLATGTGIAPVKAMVDSLTHWPQAQRPGPVTVYWGGRTPADLYTDIAACAAVNRFVPVLSRADDSWQGARGYVQQALLDDAPDLSQLQVYACGSSAMVRSAQQRLLAAGLPAKQFHADAFVCSAAA